MQLLHIFTMVNHGSLIKIQCMAGPRQYLRTALARTLGCKPTYKNAYVLLTKVQQKEVDEIIEVLGIIYYVTRKYPNSWVKEDWLLKTLNLTKSKLKRYVKILKDGVKYKGAGGYIQERLGEDGQMWYQINVTTFLDYNNDYNPQYNLNFLESNNQLQTAFATLLVAEYENIVDEYHDTGIKKDTTLQDVGQFSVHDVDECFEIILKLINENLFPIPVDASALSASKVKDKGAVIYENTLAMF